MNIKLTECNQVTLIWYCNRVHSGNLDTSAQVLLISVLYFYHKWIKLNVNDDFLLYIVDFVLLFMFID